MTNNYKKEIIIRNDILQANKMMSAKISSIDENLPITFVSPGVSLEQGNMEEIFFIVANINIYFEVVSQLSIFYLFI